MSECPVIVPQGAARRVPLAAACAARRATQFRLRQGNAMQVRLTKQVGQRLWVLTGDLGNKIAEFLVEIELVPHFPKKGPFKIRAVA